MEKQASIDFINVYREDIYHYQLAGFFGLDQSEMINNIFDESLKKGVNKFIFELTELNFISSAGIGAFLGHIKKIKEKKGDMVFVNMPEKIKRVFHAFIITNYFKIVDDVNQALDYFENLEQKEKTLVIEPETQKEDIEDQELSQQYFSSKTTLSSIVILSVPIQVVGYDPSYSTFTIEILQSLFQFCTELAKHYNQVTKRSFFFHKPVSKSNFTR